MTFPSASPPSWGAHGGGGAGGRGSGGDRIKAFKQKYYAALKKVLNACIQSVFGSDAAKVPEQTLSNAPILNVTLSGSQLGALYNEANAVGGNAPFKGENGTIYIASSTFNTATFPVNALIYSHELGNILDEHLYPDSSSPDFGKHHGDPNSTEDKDTGQAFADCINNSPH